MAGFAGFKEVTRHRIAGQEAAICGMPDTAGLLERVLKPHRTAGRNGRSRPRVRGLGLHEDRGLPSPMSSPTVLFVLERLAQEKAPRPCVALGFGPGLVAEVMLLD
mgnify:CR=1 FL=1